MHPSEFAYFSVVNWKLLGFNILLHIIILLITFRNYTPARLYDPFHFYFSFTMGTAYGIMTTLYIKGYIEDALFWKIFTINILFITLLLFFKRMNFGYSKLLNLLMFPNFPNITVKLIYFLFFILSFFFIIKTGPLIFYESRFEAVKGIGLLKRIFEVIRLFVIGYLSLDIVRYRNNNIKKIFKLFLLIFLILVSSMLNGSKFSLLESIYVVILSLVIYKGKQLKISFFKLLFIVAVSIIFAIMVLYSQLHNKIESISSIYGTNNVILERFVFRILSNGDQVYMLLPDNVIDKIKVNNPIITLISPIIGSTYLSKILNYNVNDYNVGRQAILYFYPTYEVAGGPTSHFDLYGYKYFTFFGAIIFTFIIAIFLSYFRGLSFIGHNFNFSENKRRFISVLFAILWLRILSIILEPHIGIARLIDIIAIFFMLKLFSAFIYNLSHKVNNK